MKNLFIFLNIILFICVVFLFMLHFSHKSPPPEKVLNQTPSEPNIQVAPVFDNRNSSLNASELALIVDNDLFSPNRGVDPDSVKATAAGGRAMKHNQLELTGLCKMGDVKGAIIVNMGARPTGTTPKQFYLVGDTIEGTPYRLLDINPEEETAIISMGATQFSLKLERNDKGSNMRRSKGEAESKSLINATKPKIAPKPAVKPTSPTKKTTPKYKPKSPRSNASQKTPEEMKKIRQDILKKMMERKQQPKSNKR